MTEVPIKIEVNCATGIAVEVPLTQAEIDQREVDATEAKVERAKHDAAEAAKADAKLAAQAKLQALGLTGEEIAAITE